MVRSTPVQFIVSDSKYTPVYSSDGAAGADVFAAVEEPVLILPGERALIPTGVSLALPDGYQVSVRPRSGLAAKFGVTVLNTPGLIDPDYRGEIKVILYNSGRDTFTVAPGERIAQLTVEEVIRLDLTPVEKFEDETSRGVGGFGSTGR